MKVNVLVCMCGFAVDVKREAAVGIALDVDVQHVDAAVFLHLLCPLDAGVDVVDVGEEGLKVVLVDGDERVIGLSHPELDMLEHA